MENTFKGSKNYVASPELMNAVNIAMALKKPLLIKGEPGTGKTMLAEAVAEALGKKLISRLLNTCYRKQGLKDTVIFADQLMYTGFHYAALSGASVGIDDMVIPDAKKDIIAAAEAEVAEIQDQFLSGLVTAGERYN